MSTKWGIETKIGRSLHSKSEDHDWNPKIRKTRKCKPLVWMHVVMQVVMHKNCFPTLQMCLPVPKHRDVWLGIKKIPKNAHRKSPGFWGTFTTANSDYRVGLNRQMLLGHNKKTVMLSETAYTTHRFSLVLFQLSSVLYQRLGRKATKHFGVQPVSET